MTRALRCHTLAETIEAAAFEPQRPLITAYERMAASESNAVFIKTTPFDTALEQLAHQERRRAAGESLPLFGVPVAIKDNIDVEGLPTTAACPSFGYRAMRSASAVLRLTEAGAIVVGKTNLDQFATGLVGVRTPYGIPRSAVNSALVAGGSSSGSALAVALGIVPIALGTDTAGSGRVPAAFNGIVGLKPTRGLVSTCGVVPACRSLDCVSVFASNVGDARRALEVIQGYDDADPFSRRAPETGHLHGASRLRIGIPERLEWFGNREYEALYASAVSRLLALGYERVPVDIDPFLEAGKLLYGGPWVAERYASVGEFVERSPDDVHPTVREIILAGKRHAAHELFRAQHQLAQLRRDTSRTWAAVDAMILPTTATIYTVEDVLANPIESNANLGLYTNFVNLLDLSALALPAGTSASGAPFGITLLAPAFSESLLTHLGDRLAS